MCVRIRFNSCVQPPIYDAEDGSITLPTALDHTHAVTALRAVLSELRVQQPQLGAVCWCGESVTLLPRVPQQRRSEQVIKHGA
ncbi:hypothetical protein GCM10023084_02430 [Streptomyces lacrimifluminis]